MHERGLKERIKSGGEREKRTERNFGAQDRCVLLGRRFGGGIGNRRGRRSAGERDCEPADRAENRAEEKREQDADPAEERPRHAEQKHVTHSDAFASAQQAIGLAGHEQRAAAQRDSEQRALPSDLGHRERGEGEADWHAGERDEIRDQTPVVVDNGDDKQRRAEDEARDRVGQREMEIEVGGGAGQRELREKIAERNRPAAHQASPAQKDVGEDRNVGPPWDRALAARAERARPHDRDVARQPIRDDIDEASDRGAEDKREQRHQSARYVDHRPLTSAVATSLTSRRAPCHCPSGEALEARLADLFGNRMRIVNAGEPNRKLRAGGRGDDSIAQSEKLLPCSLVDFDRADIGQLHMPFAARKEPGPFNQALRGKAPAYPAARDGGPDEQEKSGDPQDRNQWPIGLTKEQHVDTADNYGDAEDDRAGEFPPRRPYAQQCELAHGSRPRRDQARAASRTERRALRRLGAALRASHRGIPDRENSSEIISDTRDRRNSSAGRR